jgi:diguanylate cyclase (GGDEF)-like protein
VLIESQRPLRLIGHRFAAAVEQSFRLDQQADSWLVRLIVALMFVGVSVALYWLIPMAGGLRIEPESLSGALLYALVVPMLTAVALTAAIPQLRRFADTASLISVVVVTLGVAAIVSSEQLRQPLALSPGICGLYLLPALMLLRLPAHRGLVAGLAALAGCLALLGARNWAAPYLRSDVILLILLTVPALGSALFVDRAARKLWLCEQLLATSARQDYLTGLLNRRAFEAEATELLQKAVRNGTPSALLLLDIDHFKMVNDLYGHARGDQVLKEVAAVIGKAGRKPEDLCSRYGGEEFAILWTDCDAASARRSAETLLLEIRRLNIENKGSKVADVVTSSAGLIAWQTDPVGDIQDGLSQADNLLYMAKRSGRNRLVTLNSAAQGEG